MLLISEIYTTISGESRFSGWPCTLVRLTGCHLRCTWCDSAHAFHGGERRTVADIVAEVCANGHNLVLVTGGEPLLQASVGDLMTALLADGRRVLLETSGTRLPVNALPLTGVPAGVHRVVDIKAPASGIAAAEMDWEGIGQLGPADELKIVCADRDDYLWARDLIKTDGQLPAGVRVALSPVQDNLAARDLAAWILEDRLQVCLQIQLHKAIWPDVERGV